MYALRHFLDKMMSLEYGMIPNRRFPLGRRVLCFLVWNCPGVLE